MSYPWEEDFWTDIGGELGGAFTNFGNLVVSTGGSLIGTIGDGVIGVYQDAAGGVAYAIDATKATASDIGAWTEGAAGTVADFSIDTYGKAKEGLKAAWEDIAQWGLSSLPTLGPYNPTAREAMKYLLCGSEEA